MGRTITPVRVKDVVIGEGAPTIVVPVTGRTPEELCEQIAAVADRADVVEWRVDFFHTVDDVASVVAQAGALAEQVQGTPLLATCRTSNEGGEIAIGDDAYADLTVALAESGAVDLVDVEYRRDRTAVERIVAAAHARGVAVVASNHDFDATPPKDEIVARLRQMQELGADICKIAVMPRSTADVLTLLDATRTMHEDHADRPLITMSMGGLGVVSRIAGHVFGSAATFGMVGTASAPGQVDADELRSVLGLIDRAR
ncbi:3-dehydroquinate dehydratase [Rhodococcus pyridinivorans KG-16]|uniref:3-dehydroquinate dehydratase n=1 Tax=Rhodococcus pyridinivorans KG-16 TaxID=1441730 RepID=A0A0V9UQE9_9NOCA|nr:type I 3-dehydroquinate dehydratase [Rhodococcus pyridinivorans]KSZ60241.1 3-dehydroquinate dehydratase [Rhodococcus pyridinivorans KG-16]